MELSREALSARFETSLTENDVKLIDENGHDETTLSLLATEHASRCQALLRCADPAFAARLFLIIADRFLTDAQASQTIALRHA